MTEKGTVANLSHSLLYTLNKLPSRSSKYGYLLISYILDKTAILTASKWTIEHCFKSDHRSSTALNKFGPP